MKISSLYLYAVLLQGLIECLYVMVSFVLHQVFSRFAKQISFKFRQTKFFRPTNQGYEVHTTTVVEKCPVV